MARVRKRPAARWRVPSLALGGVAMAALLAQLLFATYPDILTALLLLPLLAGAGLGVRVAAGMGGCVLVAGAVTGAVALQLPLWDTAIRTGVLAVGAALAVHTARRQRSREKVLIQASQTIQRIMLPPVSVRAGGVDLATRYVPAGRDAVAGGDLVAVADSPYGLRVMVGDVRGHDLHAVCLAAVAVGAFRDLAYVSPDLPGLVMRLDEALGGHLDAEDFVTVVIAEFAPGEVRLVNCGHPAPLRINSRPGALEPADPGPPLGLRPQPRLQRYWLAPGERLLLFTDGLIDARSPDGAALALDGRVWKALSQPLLPDCLEALHNVAVEHATGPLADDLALVMCEPLPVHAPTPPQTPHGHQPDSPRQPRSENR
ncbi:PP2C family protein-serine/threonine phosphatase [Streptomyces monticola]|uniref:PP2C family protein-serine/threonine phosphatase n=1 Tax=Streptomyces monticola TaxID=2666263 RepID=A0ABW2JAZ6_9ACTN